MRHPLPLAKELATLQNFSEGRLILGAGVGWLEAEFAALGSPFHERGRRTDEGIAMMRAVWTQDPVSFRSKYIPAEITEMTMQPLPVRPIPIWFGARSEAAYQRTVRIGDGWHGSQLTPEEAAPIVKRLRSDRLEPEFTSQSASPSANGATLTASAHTYGIPYPIGFRYGTALGSETTPVPAPVGKDDVTVSSHVTGLATGAIEAASGTGTFSVFVVGSGPAPRHFAVASFGANDAVCKEIAADSADALSGSVTLTANGGGAYAGTYDLTFDSGDRVTGKFQTATCQGLTTYLGRLTHDCG